jgi:hypothetical protein
MRMKQVITSCGVLGLLLLGPEWARADFIVLDDSPARTGAEVSVAYENVATSQNFADSVLFAHGVQLSGMDIYTTARPGVPFEGLPVEIGIWTDSSGLPGVRIYDFTESISATDAQGATSGLMRVHADFTTPVTLAAGTTYWIGMSAAPGNPYDIGQVGLLGPNAPDDGKMEQFSGTMLEGGLRSIGDMAFRLEGAPALPVPEPSGLLLAGLGSLTLLGYVCRGRKVSWPRCTVAP